MSIFILTCKNKYKRRELIFKINNKPPTYPDLVESSVSGDDTESRDRDGVTWIVDGFDILYAYFRAISQQIPPADLSDLRLL